MDIVAHGLWAGIGVAALARWRPSTLACWEWTRTLWLPLLGWWSHIAIDVFTHSKDFYPAPIFYPFSQWGFDGLAWNTPWFLVANHAAIALALAWLLGRRRLERKAVA